MTLQRTTPLTRSAPLARSSCPSRSAAPSRSAMRRTPPVERDWTAALQKVRREGTCRVCDRSDDDLVAVGQHVEAAHTIGRGHDRRPEPGGPVVVDPDDVCPLCSGCHRDYDGRRIDLLPHLTRVEQAAAVRHVGLVAAHHRLTSTRTPPPEESP